MEEGMAPCGRFVDDTRREQWRQEFSCTLIGCKSCSLYNGGEIYYEGNMKRGLAIWARQQLKEMREEKG